MSWRWKPCANKKANKKEECQLNRRELLRSSGMAGAALLLSHKSASAASGIGDAIQQPSSNSQRLVSRERILGRGDTALTVSAVSLGCMGMHAGRGRMPDEVMMERLIQQAYDRGCTFFDTAEVYGNGRNEALLGRSIASFRDKVIIGTKFMPDLPRNPPTNSRPERIKAACEDSLRRLRTDVIDLYHQHRVDRSVPIEDVAGTVADLIKEGKVRRFALSEVGAETIRRAHRVCPVTAVQSEYHLMFRKPETEVFSTMQELGISLVAYSPLNRGFLGGTLTEYADMNTNDGRGAWPRFTREALRANTRIVEVLNEFGKTRGMTSAQIALAWMMSKHPFIVPVFGTTKLSHLEEDLRASDYTLTADEITDLETKVSAFPVVGDRYDALQQSRVEY
jgi:aryl-alcohol dehydrogenase-like predicted oxidoreductase